MHVLVLGAAAGGGFPQWNANHPACQRARSGDAAARPATQASIAVSVDRQRWVLINASPDIRQQIEHNRSLWPASGLRHSPIAAVILTNADVDAVAGLLSLREGTPFALYAHARVHETLDANPIFDVCNRDIVPRRTLDVGSGLALADAAGAFLGIELMACHAPGKIPLYREREVTGELQTMAEDGDTLGLDIRASGRRIVYLANCARITDAVRQWSAGADLLFMDGTLWRDDEMIALGVGQKTGRRMGHISMSGDDGAMAGLNGVAVGRRIFIHINNTNPALLADSDERRAIEERGWEVAYDGMEVEL